MSAPVCLFCGKPIPKWMERKHFRNEEQEARGIGGRDWMTVPQLPRTIEEAQRLTNWTITRVERLSSGQSDPGAICTAIGWDGVTYWPRHDYFCKIDCAARFGRTMADRGARL
jgi:hypothetical protein